VLWEGAVAGVQSFATRDFLITRSGETGSWLGRRFQGRGIGTTMRQVVCAFAFDHLGAEEVVSGAFTDNPASWGVSRKVGYVPTGTRRMERLGECATVQDFSLTPEALVRYEHPLTVAGLPELRRSVGLGV
jgi:RimJ/RimL family protein N-acetyltransferase